MRHLTFIACALTLSASAVHAQYGDPPSRVARISALVGQASLQPSGANDWSEAPGMSSASVHPAVRRLFSNALTFESQAAYLRPLWYM